MRPAAGTRVEVESGTCDGTIDSNHGGFSGTGFCNLTNAVGSAAQVSVTPSSAGSAALTIRYYNGTTTARPKDISVNGTVAAAGHSFASTGTWDAWADYALTVPLNAGANTVRLVSTSADGGPNQEYVQS